MFALFFLLGVSFAFQLSDLPDGYWLLLFVPLFSLIYRFPKYRIYLALPLGFLWVLAQGVWVLSSELPANLLKQNILVSGKISSLPSKNSMRTRFVLDVDSSEYQNEKFPGPKRIRLNWYRDAADIHAGQYWQLLVRLKPAHGMQNPGSFDYERWLFERGIRATGYVRSSEKNKLLKDAGPIGSNHLRERLKIMIQDFLPDSEFRGLILALAIGDRSEISDSQWQVLTATGTNHLVAISGLHIGLVAGGVYFVFLFLFRRIPRLLVMISAQKLAAIMGLLAAFFYAMLAGFAVPTQRALVMIAVVMMGVLLNKRFGFGQIISFALLAVLLMDPFSVLSTGFWLSFFAVAAILYAMQGRLAPDGIWWQWGRMQWIVGLALVPILIFSFQSFSLISPITNIIAVPWVSFITVPLLLVGILLSFIEPLGQVLIYLASLSLQLLWGILGYFSELRFAQWQQFAPQTWTLLPALIGILLAITPRGFPVRYLSIIFLLPLFVVKPEKLAQSELNFYLLDVGQGLSAVVQTRNHVLVFDTGPKFPSGFNTGESVILPFLKTLAIEKLDVLMISHGDNDHIGGMYGVLDNIQVDQIISGVMNKTPQGNAKSCTAGLNWDWDGVNFELLHPAGPEFVGKGNNGSCVLRISASGRRFLLTGDIEKEAEKNLLERFPNKIRADVIVAPHHGSNTSSTQAFVEAVEPLWVLYAAGYANRFKFPNENVFNRYSALNVRYLTTGNQGAISFLLNKDGELLTKTYRREKRRFWHNNISR